MSYLFFWKPKEKNGYLSQWYSAEMYIGGTKYANCEQYMMAQKAILFNDKDIYHKIMITTNPSVIKNLGRKIKNFDEEIWDLHKKRIIFEGNFAKFSQNNNLLEKLLETKELILAEASPYDRIYGIGMKVDDPNIQDTSKWGDNLLGCTLMNVRNLLISDIKIFC